MGAPKQKWTAEEEAALKAGVLKHGRGKWAAILADPEFREALRSRSNVDLKDKWRNVNASAIWGSRKKEKLAARGQLPAEQDDNALAQDPLPQSDDEMVDVKPLLVSGEQPMQTGTSKKPITSMENHILEAITSSKDGFTRASIAEYIEDQYMAPPNFTNRLGAKLKDMVENGTLTKIKNKYVIALSSPISEGRQKVSFKDMNEIRTLTKAEVEEDLSKMRRMSAEEMAAAAARAVAEAEAAMAAAEAATREAEAAEAEAEVAQLFAKAAEEAWRSGIAVNQHKGGFITPDRRSMCPLFFPD